MASIGMVDRAHGKLQEYGSKLVVKLLTYSIESWYAARLLGTASLPCFSVLVY
jgi:hypothetical protein